MKTELINNIKKQIAELKEQDYENSFDPFYFMFNKGEKIKSQIRELINKLYSLGYDYYGLNA